MVNIDRPSTWKLYKNGMCNGCNAGCCQMPVEITIADLVQLELATEDEAKGSIKKLFKKLKAEGFVDSYRASSGFFTLSRKDQGDCRFLDTKTRLCTVYEKRPSVCRQFPKIGPRPGFCPQIRSPQ